MQIDLLHSVMRWQEGCEHLCAERLRLAQLRNPERGFTLGRAGLKAS